MEASTKEKVAASWLTNPVVVWGVGIALVIVLAELLLPGAFDFVKKGFNGFVDTVLDGLSSIFGKPASQQLEKRTTVDRVRGLATQGDRALSDDWDLFSFETTPGLTEYAKQRLREQGKL